MSAADCERWENRLLDLAYGEIEESDEREVRAHLDGCEHCRKSLEKLGRGRALARHFEQVEPPAEAMQVVLAAARDKALEVQAARAAAARAKAEAEAQAAMAKPADAAPARESWWSTILGIVMAPQFAMATLLLLTVGVGLWWFPDGDGGSAGAPPLLSEPTTVAVGPEALTPAEPLHFEVDPRTGRVEAHHGEEAEVAVERVRGVHVPTAEDRAPEATGSAVAALEPPHDILIALEDGDTAGEVVEEALPDLSADGPSEMAMAVAPVTEGSSAPSVAPTRPAPSAPGAAPAEEVEPPSVGGTPMLAAGLLRQARELVASHRDREAITQYETLLSRYRGAAEAPAAMLEVAACYRRIGAISRARGWLERAASQPSVASDARRELLRLDAAPDEVGTGAAEREATTGE